jgi:hypothetical protein
MGIFKFLKTLETLGAIQEVKSVLTGVLFISVRSSSFIKLLDTEKKANSRHALERLRKTMKSPRLRKKQTTMQ